MRRKNILSLFSFFIVFLLIFTLFLMINVEAKTDTHIEYAGGVEGALRYANSEHIVMNEDGNELGVAFIGLNGDPSYVSFLYRDVPSCSVWCEVPIRQTTNDTYDVRLARDMSFNIHAIYKERMADGFTHHYYKFFKWSEKKWYLSPKAITLCPSDKMGYNLTPVGTTKGGEYISEIKVDACGYVHVIISARTPVICEMIYRRYNPDIGVWDLTTTVDSEASDKAWHRCGSMGIDSSSNEIYLTYCRAIDGYPQSEYWEVWFVKSTDQGTSWGSPSKIVDKAYPQTAYNGKLIVDNQDNLHMVYRGNYSTTDNSSVVYGKSINSGSSWTWLNVTDATTSFAKQPCITMDANNIIYFTYSRKEVDTWGLYGKKFENGILGDEVNIVAKYDSDQAYLNLVYSNIYSSYADSGIIGVYEDYSIAKIDIRYLEMEYNDFIGFPYSVSLSPIKDIYYIYDTVTFTINNPTDDGAVWRVVDADGNKVIPQSGIADAYCIYRNSYSKSINLLPNGSVGTWKVQVTPSNIACDDYDFSSDQTYNYTFTVASSGLMYWISAFPSWVMLDNWVSCQFSAKSEEQYRIEIISTTGTSRGNSTTVLYGVEQNVTIDYLYLCDFIGSYYLILYNYTDDTILGVSNIFSVSQFPEDNTYTVNVASRYSYMSRPVITFHRYGVQEYRIFIYNENGIAMFSGTFNTNDRLVQLLLTVGDIGIATIQVFDSDGFPSDLNAIEVTFQIYDPEGLTGDPIIDTFISIPIWIKAIVGVMIVLGFVFIPFILSQYIAGSHKLDVPPVIYAICGGIGVTLCTLLGLFGWEIMFFICVIAGISLVISYVWQKKGD